MGKSYEKGYRLRMDLWNGMNIALSLSTSHLQDELRFLRIPASRFPIFNTDYFRPHALNGLLHFLLTITHYYRERLRMYHLCTENSIFINLLLLLHDL